MGRSRKGRPIHGWIIIDKPAGLSSSAIVGKARRALGAAKAGHGGTLDPLATGVLPVAFGEATKTVSYAMDSIKAYWFAVRWGEARATDDREGVVTETSDVRPGADQIRTMLPRFTGEIEQVPPVFSAIKVDGERAYDLARANVEIELQPRMVSVEVFEYLGSPDADHAEFRVVCGKGTYIRSLARDLAKALGTVGHVAQLRRTAVGGFTEDHAISLDYLESLGHSAPDSEAFFPVETALDDIPALALTKNEAQKLRHGQGILVLPVASRSPFKDIAQGEVVCVMAEGRMVALARIAGGEIRPLRVLNLDGLE